jgi:hypothetical protein
VIIGLLGNYPDLVFFLLWLGFVLLVCVEQTSWHELNIAWKGLLILQWLGVILFEFFLLSQLLEASKYATQLSVLAVIATLIFLIFALRRPRQLDPAKKFFVSVSTICAMFVLILI